MLATMAFTLQVVNVGLLVAGGLCCAGVLLWLVRSGQWRGPLAGVELPRQGPTVTAVAAVLLTFFVLQFVALGALGGAGTPGSVAWHRFACAEAAISLVVSGLMAVVLQQTHRPTVRYAGFPCPAEPASRSAELSSPAENGGHRDPTLPSAWASALASVVALFILLPITWALLELGRIAWSWLHPGAVPPVHIVLQALQQNQWGVWGIVQLTVGAVLVAPLAEELFFRGVLLQAVCYHFPRAWVAVSVTATAFGLVHSSQPQDVLPLATMGVVLGYIRLRTGRLWPCVLLHTLFNARTMAFVILAPELLQET
jgi:membrane protease YdiL (CAAX protease family)